MDYGRVLTRSLELAWRYKWLWLLALFAGEGSGGFSFNYSTRSGVGSPSTPSSQAPNFQPVIDWVGAHIGLLVAVGVALVLLWIVLFLVSCLAVGALVRATEVLDRDEPSGLGEALRLGVAPFWAVLRLRLLILVFGLLLVVVIGVFGGLIVLAFSLHAFVAATLLIVLAVGAGVLLIPVLVAFAVFVRIAVRVVALDGASARQAVSDAVRLMRRRIGPVVVLWAIELAIQFGVGIATLALLVAVGAPLGLFAYAAVTSLNVVTIALLAVVGLLFVAALIVVGAAVAAYLSVYWTLGFRQLQRS